MRGICAGGMELRVLHTAAHRMTWYGRWGYAFGRAGFNISAATWRRAAGRVHGAALAPLLQELPRRDPSAARIIHRYQVSTRTTPACHLLRASPAV